MGTWRVSWVLAGGTDRACGRLDGVPEKRRLGRDSKVPALSSWSGPPGERAEKQGSGREGPVVGTQELGLGHISQVRGSCSPG